VCALGKIVGLYQDSGGLHGFLYSGGIYTTLNDPAAFPGTTAASGINNLGQIVGNFGNGSGVHAGAP
jgi:hypothetical protein